MFSVGLCVTACMCHCSNEQQVFVCVFSLWRCDSVPLWFWWMQVTV